MGSLKDKVNSKAPGRQLLIPKKKKNETTKNGTPVSPMLRKD
jgi:hypothetical protein